eukprot:9480486-Pyramimonas_sp.AAC.1
MSWESGRSEILDKFTAVPEDAWRCSMASAGVGSFDFQVLGWVRERGQSLRCVAALRSSGAPGATGAAWPAGDIHFPAIQRATSSSILLDEPKRAGPRPGLAMSAIALCAGPRVSRSQAQSHGSRASRARLLAAAWRPASRISFCAGF